MRTEEIIDVLKLLCDLSAEETEHYKSLIEMYANPYLDLELNETDKNRMLLFVVAKINLELSRIRNSQNVTSFKAGEISIQNDNDCIEKAMQVYISALEGAADLLEDNGFEFLGV